ncbi:hypothetical protein [Cerasicoccus arenae]|uniref:EF-hand domain-containing protein n=1 Tax=Cerasicoccus arenae TaxID=424488 RepID=A0A8J3DDF0_9BACT|nr:hypothetical protein [Cerasicoccus arenae]MBK1859678.1 hypothetical protein [Cerasicoccus arenae]GHB92993.1 hypothetical protein GCM10007047_05470 [Cerasicoccus arenae]
METIETQPALRFFKAGGFNQLCLEKAEDIRLVLDLDETLWVASSCPVKGLDIDEKTLQLIDFDQDGRIRPPEMKETIRWVLNVLTDYDTLVEGRDWLNLSQINSESEDGARLLKSAQRILSNLGRGDDERIALADSQNRGGIFADVKSNGDGIIPEAAAEKDETKQVIRDIIASMGGEQDRGGDIGVSADKVNAFYQAAQDYLNWWVKGYPADQVHQPGYVPPVLETTALSLEDAIEAGDKAEAAVEADTPPPPEPAPNLPERDAAIFPLGADTPAAFGAVQALRGKVEEFFAQRRIAAFDVGAVTFLNFRETDLIEAGKRDEASLREVMLGLPLAHVKADADLPLTQGVNPAYAAALQALKDRAVKPLLGDKDTLTPEDWSALQSKLAAYEAWINAKKGTAVEKLGAGRLGAILRGPEKEAIQALIQVDAALAGEIKAVEEVEKLLRFHRDLFRLLNNVISFPEFYDTDKQAIFQTGYLIIDGCALHMCVEVLDLNAHSAIAQKSGIYLIYLEAKRKDQPAPIYVCAAVTSRSAGRMSVGKNGVFYDRKGRDWDAKVAKVIVNPISLREAAWAPFRAIGDIITGQIEKITQSRQKSIEQQISGSITNLDKQVAQKPPETVVESKSNGGGGMSGMGGMLAGGGVAIAALSSSFAYIAQQVKELPDVYFIYTALLIIFFVVGPSVLLGYFKLRARDIGMMLEASGWAINGRMRINLKLAQDLTHVGRFPKTATRVHYEYLSEDGRTRRRRFWLGFVGISAAIAFGFLWFTHDWEPLTTAPSVTEAKAKP